MSQESEFKTALEALKPLLNENNDFATAFRSCVCLWDSLINYDDPNHPKQLPYAINLDIGKAVEIYERRNDAHKGQAYLLFNENSKHIAELRRAIKEVGGMSVAAAVKKLELWGENTNPDEILRGKQAAIMLSEALEKVITAAKPFQNIPRIDKEKDMHVIGDGGVAIVREFGSWQLVNRDGIDFKAFTGETILEMRIEDLSRLTHKNIFMVHYADVVDMRIISKDGTVYSFNIRKSGESDLRPDVYRKIFAIGEHEKVENREEKFTQLLPELVRIAPPQVTGLTNEIKRL